MNVTPAEKEELENLRHEPERIQAIGAGLGRQPEAQREAEDGHNPDERIDGPCREDGHSGAKECRQTSE